MDFKTHSVVRTGSPVDGANALRVLVVDDIAANRACAHGLLSAWGIEPEFACNGVEALRMVIAQPYDFILMDIVMPIMDGFTSTMGIRRFERENPARLPVPVVAYSSSAVTNDLHLLHRFGFSEVVAKPSTPGELQDCLQRWCPDKFAESRRIRTASP